MGRLAELDERFYEAPDAVQGQVRPLVDQIARLLDQAADDETWAQQIGPAYTATQVASLLGVSRQAVQDRAGLLRLEQRNGRVAYPVFQFDGDRVLPGIQQVVLTLAPAVATSWTIASWVTSPHPGLGDRTPLDQLRRGQVTPVVNAAHWSAAALQR